MARYTRYMCFSFKLSHYDFLRVITPKCVKTPTCIVFVFKVNYCFENTRTYGWLSLARWLLSPYSSLARSNSPTFDLENLTLKPNKYYGKRQPVKSLLTGQLFEFKIRHPLDDLLTNVHAIWTVGSFILVGYITQVYVPLLPLYTCISIVHYDIIRLYYAIMFV